MKPLDPRGNFTSRRESARLYRPFSKYDEAVEWAGCNPVTDLSDVPWWVVPLERTTEGGEEEEHGT